jgi:hypothetical protein
MDENRIEPLQGTLDMLATVRAIAAVMGPGGEPGKEHA